MFTRLITSLFILGAPLLAGMTPEPQEKPKPQPVKYGRGYVRPPAAVRAKALARDIQRNGHRVKALPNTTAAQFDCATAFGNVPPIKDQGQCGSCFVFSGTDTAEMALMKGGVITVSGGGLAEQFIMDCHRDLGGCDGGWETDVLDVAMQTGIPLTSDYGPYKASSGACKGGAKLYKIAAWGYCDTANADGVAQTQLIKNAMAQYGPISVAVDASQFDSYNGGVLGGTGHSINHAVILVGWDDSKGAKGAWKLRNQWGVGWGIQGYMWIEYGAFDIGTDAAWASAGALPPVPPVPPVPPTPGVTITSIVVKFSDGSTQTVTPGAAATITDATTLGQLWQMKQKVPPAPMPCAQLTADLERRIAGLESQNAEFQRAIKKLQDKWVD